MSPTHLKTGETVLARRRDTVAPGASGDWKVMEKPPSPICGSE